MTRLRAYWDYLRGTYWAVPSAMAVTAVGLSVAMIQLDQAATAGLLDRLSWVYTAGPEGARAVLSTIAASMITVAGVTFSITIVGLTLASQQHAEAQHREDPTRAARHRTSRTLSNRVRVRCGRRPRRPAGGAGRPGTYVRSR